MSHQKFLNTLEISYDDESIGDDDSFCEYDAVDSLQIKPAPTLHLEEILLLRTYTYDQNPIEEFRESDVNDYMVLKVCNSFLWSKILEFLGDFPGDFYEFESSHCLYRSKAVLTLLAKIICKNNCYYLPENCFLEHENVKLRDFFQKNVHNIFNPEFDVLFRDGVSKTAKLERAKSGQPLMWKLAEDIGINTLLEYDNNGMVNIDFDVLNENFWNDERPVFVKEEKKVLDVLYALLNASKPNQEKAKLCANDKYSQKLSKMNDPKLKVMCHGPDFDSYVSADTSENCDLAKDVSKVEYTGFKTIKHSQCENFKREDHWTFKHGEDDVCDDIDENMRIDGPAVVKDTYSISYCCNMQHCWVPCKCKFCHYSRLIECVDHKLHIKFNIKDCTIQKFAQCQNHWIDHPDNFNAAEDIEIEKKVLFHNNSVTKHGQSFHLKCVKYAGLKLSCKKCKKNTKEHFQNHLTAHLQCKHCQHELKSMEEDCFWQRVCSVCGKEFKTIALRRAHQARHAIPRYRCDLCDKTCVNKFTFQRHLVETHSIVQDFEYDSEHTDEEELEEGSFTCTICGKRYSNHRNMKRHLSSSHMNSRKPKCKVCNKEFQTAFNLKVHLKMQHKVIQSTIAVESKIPTSEPTEYKCETCLKVFYSKSNLCRHIQGVHQKKLHECNLCNKTYARYEKLKDHQMKKHNQ